MNAATQPFVILLVEDERTDAYLVKWALEENRIMTDFHQVFDGDEALAYLRRLAPRFAEAPRPDLILLDLNMPRMGGLECLAAIKQDQSLRDIPVVVLSTSHARSDMAAARDLGAADFFTKPMDIHQLAESIRILGERWVSPALSNGHGKHACIPDGTASHSTGLPKNDNKMAGYHHNPDEATSHSIKHASGQAAGCPTEGEGANESPGELASNRTQTGATYD